jgi:excisionase family DNA binding protein
MLEASLMTPYSTVLDLEAGADEQPVEKILYSKKDAAYCLSISLRSLSYLIERGELPIRKIGGRVLLEKRELDKFSRRDHHSIQ